MNLLTQHNHIKLPAGNLDSHAIIHSCPVVYYYTLIAAQCDIQCSKTDIYLLNLLAQNLRQIA